MKTILFIIAAFIITSCNYSTTKNELPREEKTNDCFRFYSKNVKDTFSIFIHLPINYKIENNKQYKVVYALDANYYFDTLVYLLNKNKSENVILVGVGYKDFDAMDSLRNRDYTFPKALPKDSFVISGGADKFLSFINRELLPYIDKTYRTDTSNRTLIGHSLGGYFTLYALQQALLNKNNFFKSYVAASPSLQYCNNYLIKQFQKTSDNEYPKTLLLTFGAKEDIEDGTGTEGIDNFNSLVHLLSSLRVKKIKLKNEVYPSLEHMQTAFPTFEKALQEIK